MTFSAPLLLTLLRLVVSPIVLPFLFVYLLPMNVFWINVCLAAIFILFSMTDVFDGYLARRLDAQNELGKTLDPIADKFLMYSALIALLAAGKIYFLWVLLMIGREFFVMGLRLVASSHSILLPVSFTGKLKMFLQVVYVTVVILNPNHLLAWHVSWWNRAELLILVVTILMTLWSAYRYYRSFATELIEQKEPSKETAAFFQDDTWNNSNL